jgi:DNA-binding beta-propeller fold protein YncE
MCDDLGAAATSAAAGTSAVPLAVGDDGAVAAAGPSSWCVLPSEGTASSFSALAGERPEAVAVSPDGRLVIVGTNLNDAGAVVDLDMRTGQQDDVPMASPVGAVAVSSDGLVVAGDHDGNLLAFQVDTAGTVATGADVRCAVSLPTTQPVVAVSVSSSPGAESWAAAATDKSVLVYRLSMGTEPCATLIGGYDLLRDEGQVIDLSFDAQRRLTVLESDLNLFTFDPGAAAADVARNLAQGAQQRGWTLTAADCQVLLGTSACPR